MRAFSPVTPNHPHRNHRNTFRFTLHDPDRHRPQANIKTRARFPAGRAACAARADDPEKTPGAGTLPEVDDPNPAPTG
jgi:hypothetical protein